MYENEPSRGASSSKRSEDVCSRDLEDYSVFNGDCVPYQGEDLASYEDGDNNGGGEDEEEDDDDGILPSVLEQRPKRSFRQLVRGHSCFFIFSSKHLCLLPKRLT